MSCKTGFVGFCKGPRIDADPPPLIGSGNGPARYDPRGSRAATGQTDFFLTTDHSVLYYKRTGNALSKRFPLRTLARWGKRELYASLGGDMPVDGGTAGGHISF